MFSLFNAAHQSRPNLPHQAAHSEYRRQPVANELNEAENWGSWFDCAGISIIEAMQESSIRLPSS
jgi:hypothetical protein